MDKLWIFTVYAVVSCLVLIVATIALMIWIDRSPSKNKYDENK